MTRKKRFAKRVISTVRKPPVKYSIADILICHGKDIEIVDDLIDLGKSIGFNTSNVLKLPSNKLPQNDRVNFAIANSHLVIVLVTFNQDEPTSSNARPNVYDELRISITIKPKDTIVLQELNSNGQKVNLQSNLEGKCVIIQFNRNQLHKMYPELLTEIRSRMSIDYENELSRKLKSGGVLNKFLDQMDKIWDNEFDRASDKIGKDWDTENKFQTLLDEFFQQYWAVFDALIRKKVDNDQLKFLCNESIKSANILALNAWNAVADGKYKYVEDQIKRNPKNKGISEITRKTDKAFQLIRKKRDITKEKIQDYMSAIDELEDCLINL
jgi:hypothetical protein